MLPRSYTVFVCHSRTLDLDFLSQNTDSPIETKIERSKDRFCQKEKKTPLGADGARGRGTGIQLNFVPEALPRGLTTYLLYAIFDLKGPLSYTFY